MYAIVYKADGFPVCRQIPGSVFALWIKEKKYFRLLKSYLLRMDSKELQYAILRRKLM